MLQETTSLCVGLILWIHFLQIHLKSLNIVIIMATNNAECHNQSMTNNYSTLRRVIRLEESPETLLTVSLVETNFQVFLLSDERQR